MRQHTFIPKFTGSVVKIPLQPGRPRILNALNLASLESLIKRTADLSVRELQDELEEARGGVVSEWTITVTESLRSRGIYTETGNLSGTRMFERPTRFSWRKFTDQNSWFL
ncbi:hypothetical protein CPB83DRAFT_636025 [Crepidotus variabilis]|uniref:Uncharacterized protein n=1 Tax=Crepidotus variabilis TaxID=179855 RepID=A0A9P6JKW8_9AGAR|nr:hypothetical protein CPB83DRAFT_636025 [Crepidotus variabilis]